MSCRTESEVLIMNEKKWLRLEKAINELVEVGCTLELATNAAVEFEDEERLPLVANLVVGRLVEIRKDIEQAMNEWQASGEPYLDGGRE